MKFFKGFKRKKFDPTKLAYTPPEEEAASPFTQPVLTPPPYTGPSQHSTPNHPSYHSSPPSPSPTMASIFDTSPHAKQPRQSLYVKKPNKHAPVLAVSTIIIIALIGIYGYQSAQRFTKPTLPKSTAAVIPTQKAAKDKPSATVLGIIDKVSQKKPDMPTNETPSAATVADLSKLQGQAFFAKAEVGDKVLIYAKAGKAYLYRPTTDEVVQEGIVQPEGAPDPTGPTNPDLPVLRIKY